MTATKLGTGGKLAANGKEYCRETMASAMAMCHREVVPGLRICKVHVAVRKGKITLLKQRIKMLRMVKGYDPEYQAERIANIEQSIAGYERSIAQPEIFRAQETEKAERLAVRAEHEYPDPTLHYHVRVQLPAIGSAARTPGYATSAEALDYISALPTMGPGHDTEILTCSDPACRMANV